MHYLAELTLQLNRAAAVLPEPFRACHAAFLRHAQQADGGFPGRAGASDVYYTSFALRGLLILGELDDNVAQRAGAFLAGRTDQPRNAVELFALLSSATIIEATGGGDWFSSAGNDPIGLVQRVLGPLQCSDGGLAKSAGSGVGSTYHTFLAALCRELVGLPAGNADEVAPMLRSRQRDDGGFVELPVMRRSGVNPTAAAIALLRMLDAMDESLRDGAAGFLASMQTVEGGFRAHAVIPVADLLSTFTGLVALGDLGRSERINADAARRFVASLALPDGGYLAAAQDDRADVEYTFYGIAASSLLWSHAARP